jgi:membrane protein
MAGVAEKQRQEKRRGPVGSAVWLVKTTASDWLDDSAPSLAAALAYYALLSLAPLIVLALALAGLLFDQQAARGGISAELSGVVGSAGATAIESIVKSAKSPGSGIVSSVLGLVVLLFGASGVFGELQSALNAIWEVAPRPGRGLKGLIRDRLFSFAMVMGVAFLLLVSLIFSAGLAAVGRLLSGSLPGGEVLWQGLNFLISLGAVTALFALTFKTVPDAKVAWRDAWTGGFVTALLFTLGKFLIGLYLGKSAISSSYGAAGSLVLLVIWVYYSASILLFGAEFTQVFARRFGTRIEPDKNAVRKPRTTATPTSEHQPSAPLNPARRAGL